MPASTFPNSPNHPDLRLCWPSQRGCGERLMPARFCQIHIHLCLTCCVSRLKRDCGLPTGLLPATNIKDAFVTSPYPMSGHVFRDDGTCRCGKKAPKASPKPDTAVSQNHTIGDASGLYEETA